MEIVTSVVSDDSAIGLVTIGQDVKLYHSKLKNVCDLTSYGSLTCLSFRDTADDNPLRPKMSLRVLCM